jgi:methylglutaconyl-CoA hydratase
MNILVSKEGFVTTITLQRPEAANALSLALLQELNEALDEVSHSQDTRVVILTGSGDKAFCSGADLKERITMNEAQVRQTVNLIGDTIRKVESLPQPVIAAINGVAFGGGLELALACDLRYAADHVQLGLTETALAIIPGAGGTQRLPRIIGLTKAKEWIYTAKRVTVEEALAVGLLNQAVPKDQLMDVVLEVANRIATNGPLAVRQAKRAIDSGLQTDLSKGLAIEAECYDAILPTEDRLEGLKAFQEKRKPQYQGR